MPVSTTSNIHFSPGGGTPPGAPTAVTSVTKDAGATVSFLAPASLADTPLTSYTATPYIAGVAQTPVTTAVGSAGSITGSNGSTYVQIPVTGLTNTTAYTFTVHATNTYGRRRGIRLRPARTRRCPGWCSATTSTVPRWGHRPRNGGCTTGAGISPSPKSNGICRQRCPWTASGNLLLTATHASHTGPSYPATATRSRDPAVAVRGVPVQRPHLRPGCERQHDDVRDQHSRSAPRRNRRQRAVAGVCCGWKGSDYLDAWKTDP